jgi:intein/homing endonuclease
MLQKGKQKELILKAKNKQTWKQLAKKLNINEAYLYYELKNEIRTLNKETYKKLCLLGKINFDKFIKKKLKDHWGQSKGGKNSLGSTKILPEINFNENLAEFVGAVLGDGHVCSIKKGKKIGVYCIKIAGDLNKDMDYHQNYLKPLCEKIFNLKITEVLIKKKNERFLNLYSKELINFFIKMGIKPGNKITNQSTIPKWIFKKDKYLKSCLRGLIDTDGCIHRMSKKDPNLLRINFTNHNFSLLKDTRKAFLRLKFHPSNITSNRRFYLSRKKEINRYLKEIGFSNNRHKERLKQFKSLVV